MTHVIWDWNGTLVDDHDIVIESVNAVMTAFDGPPVTSETYLDRYHRPVHRFYEYLLGMDITDDHWRRIDSIFNDHYHSRLHAVPLAPGAEQALESVANLGHTQSLLSMWRHDLVTREAGRHGIAGWFQRIEGNRTRSGDPKSVSLKLHLEALGLNPSDVAMIGDTLDDFDAAAAIGGHIILVTGSQSPGKLRATGAPVVDSLPEAINHLPSA